MYRRIFTCMSSLSFAALVIGFVLAGTTFAAQITFTFTGTGTGTVGGVPFTDAAYTITLVGDTTAITSSLNVYHLVGTTATMAIAGIGTATITQPVEVYDNPNVHALGFALEGGYTQLGFENSAFDTYALAASLGPISGLGPSSINQFTNLASNLGPITLSSSSSVTFEAVLGNPPTTWTGNVTIPFQITSTTQDASGNRKFQKSPKSFTGTMEMYISDTGPERNQEGCYAKLLGTDESKICLDQITLISTDVLKSKNEKFLLTGTGTMTLMISGIPTAGIAYLDSKGTLKGDSSGEISVISLSGKIGGGTDEVFVLTGNIKTTLTK